MSAPLLRRLSALRKNYEVDVVTRRDTYVYDCDCINKNSARFRRLCVFRRIVERSFPMCFIYIGDFSVNITLGETQSISKDVMIALDNNLELLYRLGNCSEYIVQNNTESYLLTYTFGDIKFMVTYGEASCSKVQVGTRTVEEPIYEVICS